MYGPSLATAFNFRDAFWQMSYQIFYENSNKRAIGYVRKQGQLLKKFRVREQFLKNLGQKKPTFCFKIVMYKLLKKYPTPKK